MLRKIIDFSWFASFGVNLRNGLIFLDYQNFRGELFPPTIVGVFFPLLIFAVPRRVPYNRAMTLTDGNKVLRIFLYLLLFLISFLVFDSITVVAAVLLAVAALDLFFSRAEQKRGR